MTVYRNSLIVCCILLLAMALLCAPAAARTVYPGDTVSVGEENLDLTGLDPSVVSLVHYSDFAAGSADNSIDVANPVAFDLTESNIGGIPGTYYAWNASGLIEPSIAVEVLASPDAGQDDVTPAETAITMTAEGSGTYALGDEIVLSGTCTDNITVFLFLTGPNLAINGVKLQDVTACVIDGDMTTFTAVAVEADDTWEYRWDTSCLGAVMDPGRYTIYAESELRNYMNLAQYAAVDVALEVPTLTAGAHPASVVQGDTLVLSGTATGSPANVYVWIFGPNFRLLSNAASVAANGTFAYTLSPAWTANLAWGRYNAVIQHPMINGMQDVCIVPGTPATISAPGMTPVNLAYLTSSAARDALINALNSPAVDDIYVEIPFWIGEPWIVIDPIGDQLANTSFLIDGTTNLAASETLRVAITNVSNLTVASGNVTVGEGELNNTWSFAVDAASLEIGEYTVTVNSTVTEESVWSAVSRSAAFRVVESIVPPSAATLDLAPGWNFVSVPKRLADGNDNASAVFGDVDTAMHSIFRYDAATKLWSALDANSTIEPLNGYWVYANTSTAVDLIFASGGAATPPSKTLAAGWNAIGFSSTVPASAHDALFSVAAAWTNAIGWDADSQEYGLAIVNGGSGAYSDSRTMDPGQGYWLFMTEGGELAALTG
ncbi:hypothetical protein [Methanoculleus frigidifontis]|nr:hypothetical protein [Methanoculleus sp. FWC-SCC1]